MVFGPGRDVIEVAHAFMEFFEEESCGYCTPCRAGNVLLKDALARILDNRGEPADLVQMEELCATMKATRGAHGAREAIPPRSMAVVPQEQNGVRVASSTAPTMPSQTRRRSAASSRSAPT